MDIKKKKNGNDKHLNYSNRNKIKNNNSKNKKRLIIAIEIISKIIIVQTKRD